MIDYDTSKYPAGALEWRALLEAIEGASPEDESEWIEFKAQLDLSRKDARPVLARAIVAFANREVARAAQHFEGRGLIVIGLQPGKLVGAPALDPADLHSAIQPYLADPAPRWDVHYITYKDTSVQVVVVDAPQPGDPIHCIAKEGNKVRDGDVYVRNLGKSDPARSADLRRLSTRLLAQSGPSLGVEVLTDAAEGVPTFLEKHGWVEEWIDAERDRLMAPLAPPSRAPQADHGIDTAGLAARGLLDERLLKQISAVKNFAHVPPLSAQIQGMHEESRTKFAYEAEVEAYLDVCRDRLPKAAKRLRLALTPTVVFQVQNLTDGNIEKLEVLVHVEGDVIALDRQAEFRGLGSYTPDPPQIWGSWVKSRALVINSQRFSAVTSSRPSVATRVPPPGPTIVNGGSADITFQPLDLRAHARLDLSDGLRLLAGSDLGDDITCTWSATATNRNGKAEGTFTIPIAERPTDLSGYLHHGSSDRTWNIDDPQSNVIDHSRWDAEPDF